jgi:hypothetical protein
MLPSRLRPGPGGERLEPIRPGPLGGGYAPAAAMVVLFLVPYLGLSSALLPLTPIIAAQLHVSLHRRAGAAGSVHEPAAHRLVAAAGPGLSGVQAARDGSDL